MPCVATVFIVLCGFVNFSNAKENECPGGKASCPDDSTCFVLNNGSFGCCPILNAVSCGDSVHCCPDRYACDVIKGICKLGRESVPLLKKIPSMPIKVCSSLSIFFIYILWTAACKRPRGYKPTCLLTKKCWLLTLLDIALPLSLYNINLLQLTYLQDIGIVGND